ncbi:hypothetical protein ACQUSR_26510 [Streptomyces sp. P1-3]|uniref:hypothetical protein n=1 Tax=Streptomyces sp. P1-3 TaxID=3421658 RepID=UPI003D365B00
MPDTPPRAGAGTEPKPEPGPVPAAEPGTEAGPGPDPGAGLDPEASAPLGVVRTPTGNPRVDAELDRLADADHLAAAGHLEVYEDVHRGLRETLAALDRRPGPPAPSTPYDIRS